MSEFKHVDEMMKLQLKDFVESQRIAHIGTWRLNLMTNEVVWSEELYKMYGFDPNAPVPPYTEHMKLFTPESWNLLSSSLERTRTSGIPYELELKTITKEGSNGWMWVRGEAEKNADGTIISIWGAAQDISERKTAEEKLRVSESRFQEVVRNLNAGIVVHAADSKIIDYNERAANLLGLSKEQLIGKDATDPGWTFVYEDGSPLDVDDYPVNDVLKRKRVLENKLIGVKHVQTGRITWIMVNGTPILNNSGDVSEVVMSFIDYTEIKESKKIIQYSEEQYRLLTTEMQLGQALHEIICDENGKPVDYRFISVNDAFVRLTKRRREDIVGKTVLEVLPNTEKSWIERFGVVALSRQSTQFEDYAIEFGRFYSVAAYSPKHGQFAVVIDDITERKEIEHQLYQEKELFKTTLISVGDGVISTDTRGNVLIMNTVAEQLTGWTQEDAIGKPIESVFNIIDEVTREKVANPVLKVLAKRETIELDNNTILVSRDGTERPVEDSAAPVIDEHDHLAGVVLVFRDFTGKKKSIDEIKFLSFNDYLTGLYNRRFYEAELVRLDTQRNWPLTIVMGDVNGLKLINDSFGHLKGDQLLRKVSKAMRKACRSDDIIARMGGDEFAILLPRTNGIEALQLIKRINNHLQDENIEGLEISISFGYATKMSEADDTEKVFKKAEDDMYHNKLYEAPSIKGKVIDNIIEALNHKSKREEIHSRHVSELCVKMGEALGLEENSIEELKAFGLLHDIGKIAIADTILNKTDKLTENEWVEMKSHAETGYRILGTNSDMKEIAEYALAHHERWDGQGYPKGLKGEEIPLPARICAIADAYDAMISIRSYKSSLTNEIALAELKNNAGSQFDPQLVHIFINRVVYENDDLLAMQILGVE